MLYPLDSKSMNLGLILSLLALSLSFLFDDFKPTCVLNETGISHQTTLKSTQHRLDAFKGKILFNHKFNP